MPKSARHVAHRPTERRRIASRGWILAATRALAFVLALGLGLAPGHVWASAGHGVGYAHSDADHEPSQHEHSGNDMSVPHCTAHHCGTSGWARAETIELLLPAWARSLFSVSPGSIALGIALVPEVPPPRSPS